MKNSTIRTIIYILIALAVMIPLFKPFNMPVPISDPVIKAYDIMEKLKPGDMALFSFDFGPGGKPECYPGAVATLRHAFKKNVKVVAVCLFPEGALFTQKALQTTAKEYNKEYGVDYINLGYKSGEIAALQKMIGNMKEAFPLDHLGEKTGKFSIMDNVKTIKDFKVILDFSSAYPGVREYITIAQAQTKVPVIGCVTAVNATEFYPYLQSGQLAGLLGGMKGSAEYEELLKIKGTATSGMDSQSICHLLIIFLIIITNVIYFTERKKKN